jgi:2-methylcitrate dehydratase PrpD
VGAFVLRSGERIEHHVRHASGTIGNPMSDRAIEDKFLANAVPVIGSERAQRVCETVWRLEALDDLRALIALCE